MQKDFISPVDLHERGLSILAGVVVWMPCLNQLPVAAGYILKRSLSFERQYLQHTSGLELTLLTSSALWGIGRYAPAS